VAPSDSAIRALLTAWWVPQCRHLNRAPPGNCTNVCSSDEDLAPQLPQSKVNAVTRSMPPAALKTASKLEIWIGVRLGMGATGGGGALGCGRYCDQPVETPTGSIGWNRDRPTAHHFTDQKSDDPR